MSSSLAARVLCAILVGSFPAAVSSPPSFATTNGEGASNGSMTAAPRQSSQDSNVASRIADGWERLRIRDFRAALSAFERATRAASGNPSAWLGLATAHARLWHDAEARRALTQVLALDQNSIPGHVLMGDLLSRNDDTRTALVHYQVAARLDPNDVAIQDRLMALQRDVDHEAQLATLRRGVLTVKYPRGARSAAERAMDRLAVIARRIARTFGDDAAMPIVVLLHRDAGFPAEVDAPPWAGGIFDGRIHLPLRLMTQGDEVIDRALSHEYGHATIHRLGGGRVPGWLDEGLSLYCEGGRPERHHLSTARQKAEFRPLHAMHGSFLSLAGQDAGVIYAESYDATVYLIERFGLAAVARLVKTLSGPGEFAETFETVLKEPYHVFEAAWAAHERGLRH